MINERNDLLNEKQPQKAQNLLFEFSFIRLNSGHKSKIFISYTIQAIDFKQ